ncbi:hypothetical protein DM01DRAFT_1330687 [Hesseltinella vesiculosa]|uniref:Uncharacterized protein n=1 Tax=Hesseltinella vesiculosa TaxID=101127 RepID=A0A1X2GWU8_9FUNG|nr:hypothetical protein DM01DRAFT_1330687 [Hesseltinella vesiculosa]
MTHAIKIRAPATKVCDYTYMMESFLPHVKSKVNLSDEEASAPDLWRDLLELAGPVVKKHVGRNPIIQWQHLDAQMCDDMVLDFVDYASQSYLALDLTLCPRQVALILRHKYDNILHIVRQKIRNGQLPQPTVHGAIKPGKKRKSHTFSINDLCMSDSSGSISPPQRHEEGALAFDDVPVEPIDTLEMASSTGRPLDPASPSPIPAPVSLRSTSTASVKRARLETD